MARIYYDTTRTHDGKGLTIISQVSVENQTSADGEAADPQEKSTATQRLRARRSCSRWSASTPSPTSPGTEGKSPESVRELTSRRCAPSFNVFVVNERDHEVYKIFSTKDKTKAEHIKPTAKVELSALPSASPLAPSSHHLLLSSAPSAGSFSSPTRGCERQETLNSSFGIKTPSPTAGLPSSVSSSSLVFDFAFSPLSSSPVLPHLFSSRLHDALLGSHALHEPARLRDVWQGATAQR
eukprot:439519-Hanusia_phi.AAC.2